MEIEENDEIIGEFDVIIDNNLINKLKLLQYPLRPGVNPYNEGATLNKISFNENIYNFQYSTTIKSNPTNNISSMESRIKNQVNFSLKGEVINPNTNYCVGVLKNDILTINPISEIIQMRPNPENPGKEKDVENINQAMRNFYNKVKSTKSHGNIFTKETQNTTQTINLTPFNEHSSDSKYYFRKLFFNDKPSNKLTKELLSEETYKSLVFNDISQITVAEKLYEEATNTKGVIEINQMSIKDKVLYLFNKSNVLSLDNILRICNLEKESRISKTPIEKLLDSLIEVITYYCRFANSRLLVSKIITNDSLPMINYLIANLTHGAQKSVLLAYPNINNELQGLLQTYAEYFSGKWYLKGHKESINRPSYNAKSEINNNNDSLDRLSGSELELFMLTYIYNKLSNKINDDKKYFEQYKTINNNYSFNNINQLTGNNGNSSKISSQNTVKQPSEEIEIIAKSLFKETYYMDISGYQKLVSKEIQKSGKFNHLSNSEIEELLQNALAKECVISGGNIYLKDIPTLSNEDNSARLEILNRILSKGSISKSEVASLISNQDLTKEIMKSINSSLKGSTYTLKK